MMQKLNICKLISKMILFFLSGLLLVVSAFLSYVVIAILFAYKPFQNIIFVNNTTIPIIMTLLIAVFMFIIGLLGILILFTNNRYLLIFYFILLTVLFTTELTAFIVAYKYEPEIDDYVDVNLGKTIKEFYGHLNSSRLARSLDYIQNTFKCCGQRNYTDWLDTYWYSNRNGFELVNDTQVPQSCCVDYVFDIKNYKKHYYNLNDTIQMNDTNEVIYCLAKSSSPNNLDNYYTNGCYSKLKEYISINYQYILILIVVYAFIHFMAIIAILALINYKIKLLKRSSHPPYVNIEAEYEDEYTNQQTISS